jgi:hypothetical protein
MVEFGSRFRLDLKRNRQGAGGGPGLLPIKRPDGPAAMRVAPVRELAGDRSLALGYE